MENNPTRRFVVELNSLKNIEKVGDTYKWFSLVLAITMSNEDPNDVKFFVWDEEKGEITYFEEIKEATNFYCERKADMICNI